MSKKLIGMALAGASLLAYAAATDGARASTFTVNVNQVGANVVLNGSGTVDTNALSFVNPLGFNSPPAIEPKSGFLSAGASADPDIYSGTITGPTNFGTGGLSFPSVTTLGTGDIVVLDKIPGQLGVPHLYVSGNPLSDTATFLGQSFTSLGLTPGTYIWTYQSATTAPSIGVGDAAAVDSFVLNIGTPLPTALPLFATGIGGLGLLGWRRKRKALAV